MSEIPEKPLKIEGEFGAWRERLMKSLRQCGVQPAPRLILLRYFAAVIAFILFAALAFAVRIGGDMAVQKGVPSLVILACQLVYSIFAVAVLSRIRNALVRNARRASARGAERELSRRNSRRPVFYLRSFRMDNVLGRPSLLERYLGTWPLATEEQRITSKLRTVGPVIAIGRPKDKLPQLGAARFYVSDELWKQKVGEVVRESQLVVWMSGLTDALGWELEHLRENLEPKRLMLWAHPHLLGHTEQRREEEWRAFLTKFGKYFPKPLPNRLGDARYFVFAPDWTPIPSPPQMSAIFAKPDVSALKRALSIREKVCDAETMQTLGDLSENRNCRSFGDVIGARRIERDWPRLLGFTFAMCLAWFFGVRLNEWFWDRAQPPSFHFSDFTRSLSYYLIDAALLAGAYGLMRSSFLAIPISYLTSEVVGWVRGGGFLISNVAADIAQVSSLALTVTNSSRLLVGLGLGMWVGATLKAYAINIATIFHQKQPANPTSEWSETWDFCTDEIERLQFQWITEGAIIAAIFLMLFCIILKMLPVMMRKVD